MRLHAEVGMLRSREGVEGLFYQTFPELSDLRWPSRFEEWAGRLAAHTVDGDAACFLVRSSDFGGGAGCTPFNAANNSPAISSNPAPIVLCAFSPATGQPSLLSHRGK